MKILNYLNSNLITPASTSWPLSENSNSIPLDRLKCSFQLFNRLTDIEPNLPDFESIGRSNIRLNLISSSLGDRTWNHLPIQSHIIDGSTEARVCLTEDALEEIARIFPSCTPFFERMAYNLAFVRLNTSTTKDSQITSASFPCLPFTIFVSDKAFFHIPPNTVSTSPSIYYFLENLIHELIHQLVNLSLFDSSIFPQSFNASTAPKIEIPWRSNSGERNRAWELDRAWHAYCVYIGIIEVRTKLLSEEGLLSAEESSNFTSAVFSARNATDYLQGELLSNKNHLSNSGQKVLRDLIELRGLCDSISAQ